MAKPLPDKITILSDLFESPLAFDKSVPISHQEPIMRLVN